MALHLFSGGLTTAQHDGVGCWLGAGERRPGRWNWWTDMRERVPERGVRDDPGVWAEARDSRASRLGDTGEGGIASGERLFSAAAAAADVTRDTGFDSGPGTFNIPRPLYMCFNPIALSINGFFHGIFFNDGQPCPASIPPVSSNFPTSLPSSRRHRPCRRSTCRPQDATPQPTPSTYPCTPNSQKKITSRASMPVLAVRVGCRRMCALTWSMSRFRLPLPRSTG